MKAPLALNSVIEKAILVLAFLPLVFLIYPETVAAAYTAQSPRTKALVFEVNSKQKTNLQTDEADAVIAEANNPTLTNPCYPGPIGSCNPDAAPAQQHVLKAQTTSVEVLGNLTGRTYTPEEVQQLIVEYSAQYGLNPETPLCIAKWESGYNQFSKNRHSTASGVFQYLTSTWRHTDEGKAGMSIFDAEANVKAAVKYMAIHKSTQPWTVRGKCPQLTFTK